MKIRLLAFFTALHLATGLTLAAELLSQSAAGTNDIGGGGHSSAPVFSADGRWAVFLSHAANLVTNDDHAEWLDLFARDLVKSNTVLVSVNAAGVGGGDASSAYASVSSNGQFVAFATEASNLIANDTNGAVDLFVRDLTSSATRLVSATIGGSPPRDPGVDPLNADHNPLSAKPLISADGRRVFFQSRATNLTPQADANLQTDVFARDLQAGTHYLISISRTSPQAANGRSELAGITPDGRKAAFISTSTDLVSDGSNPLGDVYVRDLGASGGATGVTIRVSAGVTNYGSSYRCLSASLSEEGRYVAFAAQIASASWLFRYDLENGTTLVASSNYVDRGEPQISADGRYIAFDDGRDVYRWDADVTNVEFVNATNALPPPVVSRLSKMDSSGNGIAYISELPNAGNSSSGVVFRVYARDMLARTTHLVSARSDGTPSNLNRESSSVDVSRDFSKIVFDSIASDLVTGDGNRARDVFVRNRLVNSTTLVSSRHSDLPRSSGLGHAYVTFGGISSNGQVVVVTSFNSDFVPDDTNGWSDVFVRDEVSRTTRAIGIFTNASMLPVLSLNGHYVAYLRGTGGGSALGFARNGEVHRFDLNNGADLPLSTNTRTPPAISGDGRYVACQGRFSESSFSGTFGVIDLERRTNIFQTTPLAGPFPDAAQFTPDSRFVLYCLSGNGVAGTVFTFDILSRSNRVVTDVTGTPVIAVSGNSRFAAIGSSNGVVIHDLIARTTQNLPVGNTRHLSLSGDGRHVVADTPLTFGGLYQVIRLDRQTGATNLITINISGTGGAEGNGIVPMVPQISADARYVVFFSAATNLVVGDTNGRADIFVRDLVLGATTRIAPGLDGGDGNAAISRPILAADGRTVVFHSVASDIVPGDYNDKRDIFVLKLGGVDSDSDGMDDDWEVAYFGNLSRDGSGDFDADGQTDLQEFRAGTGPTNSDSIFRVLTVTPLGGGNTRIIWNASPGRAYRVEFKNAVTDANWTALEGPIAWSGQTASLTDAASSSSQRYYRVVRLP